MSKPLCRSCGTYLVDLGLQSYGRHPWKCSICWKETDIPMTHKCGHPCQPCYGDCYCTEEKRSTLKCLPCSLHTLSAGNPCPPGCFTCVESTDLAFPDVSGA
jgi:hypothetical protein